MWWWESIKNRFFTINLLFYKICYNTIMLSIQTQPKYIEKEIQLPNGKWVLVIFELVEVNGKTIAKAVSGRIIEKIVILEKEEILALPVYFDRQTIEPVASPFFAEIEIILKDLSFVVSQPARAPNL
jgi:hypothetical protein